MSSTILTVVEHVTKIRITIAPPNLPPKVVVVKQTSQAGGSVSGVASFKGRTGTVVPANGDYTAAQVGADAAGSAAAALVSARSYTDALGASVTTALAGKASSSHTHAYADLTGLPTFGYFATGTDAANLSGTINAARIADGSLAQAKVTGLVTLLGTLAPLASPELTGVPTAPTAAPGTNTTQIASTAFVRGEVAALVAASPGALDTLDELAAALGDDPNFATTITTLIGTKADAVHTHTTSDVTGLTTALAGKETAGAAAAALVSANSYTDSLGSSVTTALAGKAAATHTHGMSEVTGLVAALDAKQASITFGTSVLTALGVAVGSAGAPVLFNGAGGTPSSLTLTNATGLPTAGVTGLDTALSAKQNTLVSGTSIKTINGASLLGSGDLVVSGGSKTIRVFGPQDNQAPTSGFATRDTRNGLAVLDFDDTALESAVFIYVVPNGANLASGLSVNLLWMATSATSGDVRWRAEWMRGNTDLDTNSFDTAAEASGTANATSGLTTTTTITTTGIDGLTVGDIFILRISRVATDGTNDTMTGDAELLTCEVQTVA